MYKLINSWTHYNPVRIISGSGSLTNLPSIVPNGNILLVTSPGNTSRGITDRVKTLIGEQRLFVFDRVIANPDLSDIDFAVGKVKNHEVEGIVSLGGGSVIDTGKALSVLLPKQVSQPISNVFKDGYDLPWSDSIPHTAIPTTAGTGSEVTPFATIWDSEKKKKQSINGTLLFPCTAILDPTLTNSLSPETTLYGGLDAINQAAESIWNKNATPITIELATRALQIGIPTLIRLFEGNTKSTDREQMLECSLLAGMAISQTRTSLCHSISYPLTAHFGVPHGLACAFTMPAVLKLNSKSDDGRLKCLAKRLIGKNALVLDLVKEIEDLHEHLQVIHHVNKFIGDKGAIMALAAEMITPERANNNLVKVNHQDIVNILTESWSC